MDKKEKVTYLSKHVHLKTRAETDKVCNLNVLLNRLTSQSA